MPETTQRDIARAILAACAVDPGQDFHVLRSSQVEALLEAATFCNYRAPRNASGSRARYFHARLVRATTQES